jgi:16S rRNA (adenine1518-N6/adenine1519-N6)-dimethyltransferase
MLKPRKSLGQNFLLNSGIAEKIKLALTPSKDDTLLEIGAGPGNLTSFLAPYVKKIYAVEIDERFKESLSSLREKFKNIEIVWDDFLKITINEDIKRVNKVYGNLPYNIGAPILERIAYETDIPICVFMFANGTAKRFLAKEGDRNYSSGTIFVKTFFEVEKVAYVSKGSFFPMPKVDSEVLKFTRLPGREKEFLKEFNKFTKKLFSFRRKTILNALSKTLDSKEEALRLLDILKIDHTLRVEMLSIDTLIELFRLTTTFKR